MSSLNSIQRSAIWAAYGDALGFIAELTNEVGLQKRTGKSKLDRTMPWKRNLGGNYGPVIELPAGCYSDDTQLRLSVSRSINSKGFFDVEAFAKVELPLWQSYQLGAGRGTKAAATNLANKTTVWTNNFFQEKGVNYLECGGNGAAMRIQPHVWAFPSNGDFDLLLRDITRNAVTTHGHPRGILGAVFHGLCIYFALKHGTVPLTSTLSKILETLSQLNYLVETDDELYYKWLPEWERGTGKNFADACKSTVQEMYQDIEKVNVDVENGDLSIYPMLVEKLGMKSPSVRGSGTKTAILASLLAIIARGKIEDAMITAANVLESDTDTIASMTGAILGCTVEDVPRNELMDIDYILKEAERLNRIRDNRGRQEFIYPDLLHWSAPQNYLDTIVIKDKKLIFSALGEIEVVRSQVAKESRYSTCWSWYKLSFGQHVLIKHRDTFIPASPDLKVLPSYYRSITNTDLPESAQAKLPLFEMGVPNHSSSSRSIEELNLKASHLSIDEAVDTITKSGFSENIIGQVLLRIIDESGSLEKIVALTTAIACGRWADKKQHDKLPLI